MPTSPATEAIDVSERKMGGAYRRSQRDRGMGSPTAYSVGDVGPAKAGSAMSAFLPFLASRMGTLAGRSNRRLLKYSICGASSENICPRKGFA